jgi:type IV secretory pathway protease TraF
VTILTAGLIAAAGGRWMRGRPLALMNTTPSEPIGFYWRATQAPARGRLIAVPLLAVAEGMANEVSERAQAGPDEIEAMYGELIRDQRRHAKAH